MKVSIDPELCAECGTCADICPELFETSGDCVKVKRDDVPPEFGEACQEAMEQCPMGAISIAV